MLKKIFKFFGYALLALLVLDLALAGFLFYKTPSQCQESDSAYQWMLSVLPPEQIASLRRLPMEEDPNPACSLWFSFSQDGKEVIVSALPDLIHGTKFNSSDENKTAAAIRARKHAR
ncbi:hypothetical protein [Undibacterium sp. TJN19]|uniref:hypothetical protein n=1 Tax=Undibacterium sp. TJN19 TaxID=3413055 RepID=UPI003BF37C1D